MSSQLPRQKQKGKGKEVAEQLGQAKQGREESARSSSSLTGPEMHSNGARFLARRWKLAAEPKTMMEDVNLVGGEPGRRGQRSSREDEKLALTGYYSPQPGLGMMGDVVRLVSERPGEADKQRDRKICVPAQTLP